MSVNIVWVSRLINRKEEIDRCVEIITFLAEQRIAGTEDVQDSFVTAEKWEKNTIIMDAAVENAMKNENVNLYVDVEKSEDRRLPQH